MATAEAPPNPGDPPSEVESRDAHAIAVRAELDRILRSPQFRGTKRSQEFLSFIVDQKLRGNAAQLKERWIGVEIFGRTPEYDTGEDSIVRVKANEVRKRLAQYHIQAGPAPELEIELPPGSYVPEFRWLTVPEQPAAAEPAAPEAPPPAAMAVPAVPVAAAPGKRTWVLPALAAVAIAGAALAWYVFSRPSSPFDRFWGPVISSSRPIVIYAAQPSVHRITGASQQAIQRGERPASVPSSEIVVDTDHYVGIGDAVAIARVSSFLSHRGKTTQLQIGNELPAAEAAGSPAVFVGTLPGRWPAPERAGGLRFVFERVNDSVIIADQQTPGRRWVSEDAPPYRDYAVVSRLFDGRTGQPAITAAGLSHTGSEIAAEFLTTQEYLDAAFKDAKPGWEKQNLQILLAAEVAGNKPGPPKVLETHVWKR